MSCWSFRGAQFNQAGVDNKKLLQQSDQTDSENDKILVQLESFSSDHMQRYVFIYYSM